MWITCGKLENLWIFFDREKEIHRDPQRSTAPHVEKEHKPIYNLQLDC